MPLRTRLALVTMGTCVFAAAVYVLSGRPPVPSRGSAVGRGGVGTLVPEVLEVADAAFGGDRWYLADPTANRIHVLDRDARYVRGFGRSGRGPGEFHGPAVLAATPTQVYVAERGRPDVSVFDSAGRFRVLLRVPPGCRGNVARMVTVGSDLYVLRRCIELPERIWYRVERSASGGALDVMTTVADTIGLPPAGVPVHFPLFAADTGRLVLGDGGRLCLRIFRLPDGHPQGERCLTEIPRRPMPEAERRRAEQRARGRVVVPDSLPRIVGLVLTDTGLVVQRVDDVEHATWLTLPWAAGAAGRAQPIGRQRVEQSFIAPGVQLVARTVDAGTRLEVVHGIH